MSQYLRLSDELTKQIQHDREMHTEPEFGCPNSAVIRRNPNRDKENIHRPAFVRDVEKIIHCPFYNRYADKTQVFSFFRNDDITRRALHVQLVSRIARNIGRTLNLNLDLIEAMALGHDIGHTAFGHAGEHILDELLYRHTNRHFQHNVHSVRVLDQLFARNISLQTLDGILCHNGEFEQKEYRPCKSKTFADFDEQVERSYADKEYTGTLVPATLEGCVVRICDMIAYLGKDRQDAELAQLDIPKGAFTESEIGVGNATMINNLVVNIIENSYGKDYIYLSEEYYQALKTAKRENYQYIYRNEALERTYNQTIRPMFEEMYEQFAKDLREQNHNSYIYRHHIAYIEKNQSYYKEPDYHNEEPNQIIVDYIASMTDDYFIDLYRHLFPDSKYQVNYISYFDEGGKVK